MVEVDFDQFMVDFQKQGTTITVDKKELQDALIALHKSKSVIVELKKANARLVERNKWLEVSKLADDLSKPYIEYLNLKG